MTSNASHSLMRVLLFSIFAALVTPRAEAMVPPEYVELTRDEMSSLGFKFTLRRGETGSSIDLQFPKQLRVNRFGLVPHSTTLVVRDANGNEIARALNWVAENEFRSIMSSYREAETDLTIAVTYACPRKAKNGCYGAKTFEIPSVSRFFDSNPNYVNLPQICKMVSANVYDCTEQAQPSAPADASRRR